MIYALENTEPRIAHDVFIADNAAVVGDVTIERNVSVWFGVTIRADIAPVSIGENSNVQDNSVIHVDTNLPCVIGKNVTVGHGSILHSCVIDDNALIGMGAIVLNGAHIGAGSIVAAGSVVTQGKTFPPRSLIMGSPAKVVRELRDDELEHAAQGTKRYVELGKQAARCRALTIKA